MGVMVGGGSNGLLTSFVGGGRRITMIPTGRARAVRRAFRGVEIDAIVAVGVIPTVNTGCGVAVHDPSGKESRYFGGCCRVRARIAGQRPNGDLWGRSMLVLLVMCRDFYTKKMNRNMKCAVGLSRDIICCGARLRTHSRDLTRVYSPR